MSIKTILLSGGLVTSRHASLLDDGELVRADDSRYRANDPAIWRAWGRTKYINSNGQVGGSSGKVIGLQYVHFDPTSEGASDNFLVAHRTDKYYTSVFTVRTGTFSGTTIDGVGTGTHLDAIHAKNRWYLFNGNTDGVANQVLKPALTNPGFRRHGLAPVAISPTNPPVATSAGTWPRDEDFWGEGRFFFFTTEVVGPGTTDELESAASFGEPPHVDLQKDAAGNINFNVTVTRHTPLANSTATQVNVYMAKASLNQAWDSSLLARAFRVGTISVSGTPANDKIVLSANYTFYDPTLSPTIAVVSGSIDNPTFIAVEDGSGAAVHQANSAVVDATTWGFAVPGAAAVVGMQMWIKFRNPNGGIAKIDGAFRFGAGPTVSTTKQTTTINSDYTMDVLPLNSTDTWGLSLVGTDVNSTNFGVRLSITGFTPIGGGVHTQIDVVKIRVFTSTLPSIGPAYPIIAIQEGNVLTVSGSNFPPPSAGTGDIIDAALMVDNVNNRRETAYSLPDKFDYFPELYRIAWPDSVMVIRRVGDVGLIFLRNAIWRMNYAPFSTDPEFIQGRCKEEIVPDHGCTSRQGVAVFQFPKGPILAAYVSHNGVYMNDGAHDHILTEDLDWAATVDVTQLDKAVLVNYAKEYVLQLHYIGFGTGATENNRYLLIHYHPSHRKENGHFKITGPNKMRGACAANAKVNAEHVLLLGHATDARIYVEDNDVSDAEGTGINMLWETREEYISGLGKEGTVVRTWVHQNGAGGSMTATLTPRFRNAGDAIANHTAATFAPGTEGLVLLQTHFGTVEAVRYQCSLPDAGASNAAVAFNYMLQGTDDHGTALDN